MINKELELNTKNISIVFNRDTFLELKNGSHVTGSKNIEHEYLNTLIHQYIFECLKFVYPTKSSEEIHLLVEQYKGKIK